MSGRRGRWRPPPPPPPRILHLPRRTRWSRTANFPSLKPSSSRLQLLSGRHILGTVFNLEQSFNGGERRRRVEASLSCESFRDSGEERWRLEAEILRAECNFLRMEREMALRKLEQNRMQTEALVHCAIQTLVSGRKKIEGSGGSVVGTQLEEEIEELEEKLVELRSNERSWRPLDLHRSNKSNFDRQASVLRRRLEKMAEETCEKEIPEIAVLSTLPSKQEDKQEEEEMVIMGSDKHYQFQEVEMLRRKMECLSKEMLERLEEYDYLLSVKATSLVPSTIKTRCWSSSQAQHTEMAGHARNHHEPQLPVVVGEKGGELMELTRCSCKELVGRIVEQLRAETEQWAVIQAMLEHVRQEMEELRSSRDLWQCRATSSELNLGSVHHQMLEWKQKARMSEDKATELKKRIVELKFELQTLKAEHFGPSIHASRIHTDTWNLEGLKIRDQQQKSQDVHKENEKHVLVCRLKNSKSSIPERSPFQEIGNNLSKR